jgi:hypothetical protein
MQPDDEVTRRYRGMAREEPGAAMDAAILAASRRAVAPSLSRRWGAPVSIAAVLVLAFGLTLEMRHEEPGIETSLPAPPAALPEPSNAPATPEPQAAAPAAKDSASGATVQGIAPGKERAAREDKRAAPARKLEKAAQPAEDALHRAPMPEAREAVPPQAPTERAGETPSPFPAAPEGSAAPAASRAAPPKIAAPIVEAPPSAAAALPAPPAAGAAPLRAQDLNAAPAFAPRAKAAAEAMQRAAPAAGPDAALRELERIAGLRAAGRDAEADRALEDFRRNHPGYRIPEAMWERVKPR